MRIFFSILAFISFCILGYQNSFSENDIKTLSSVVQVVKIDEKAGKEEIIFTYYPSDFQDIIIIQHLNYMGFEVRGILDKEKREAFKKFINESIGHRIKTLLDNEEAQKPVIIRETVDYLPLGFFDTKEISFERAKRLSNNPRFEDWQKKEMQESEKKKQEMMEKFH